MQTKQTQEETPAKIIMAESPNQKKPENGVQCVPSDDGVLKTTGTELKIIGSKMDTGGMSFSHLSAPMLLIALGFFSSFQSTIQLQSVTCVY